MNDRPTTNSWENGPRLATFTRSDSEEMHLNWSIYEGHTFLQYSTWRKDAQGKWKVVKTQSIRKSEFDEFIAVLNQAQELAEEPLPDGEGDE